MTANLVVHDGELDVFRFAHLSVREYLEEKRNDFASTRNHRMAANGSIRLLLDDAPNSDEVGEYERGLQNAYEYAVKYWSIHLMECGDQQPMVAPCTLLRQLLLDRLRSRWPRPNLAALQRDYLSRKQEGTGQWLLESSEMNTWKNRFGGTLFCGGLPGAGKSCLDFSQPTCYFYAHLSQARSCWHASQ